MNLQYQKIPTNITLHINNCGRSYFQWCKSSHKSLRNCCFAFLSGSKITGPLNKIQVKTLGFTCFHVKSKEIKCKCMAITKHNHKSVPHRSVSIEKLAKRWESFQIWSTCWVWNENQNLTDFTKFWTDNIYTALAAIQLGLESFLHWRNLCLLTLAPSALFEGRESALVFCSAFQWAPAVKQESKSWFRLLPNFKVLEICVHLSFQMLWHIS